MSLDDFAALLPSSENIFKQPADNPHPHQFVSFDIPEFSHFPIEDGNFGDLEFLDLACDRLLNKSKNPGQFSDIYFNSLATPSGYCSANYLTEEANRLSLLLSESGEREKGEMLDKSLIENLEDIFGVGGGGGSGQATKDNFSIDEELPSVLGALDQRKPNLGVEFEVPNDVLSIMAKNFESLEDINNKNGTAEVTASATNESSAVAGRGTVERGVAKTITIKSVRNHDSLDPPPGAVAKIILSSSKKLNLTKVVFSSIDNKEQHSFSLNTSNMRKAAECLRNYNLDNMETLRRLLKLSPHVPAMSASHAQTAPTQSSHSFIEESPRPRFLTPTVGQSSLLEMTTKESGRPSFAQELRTEEETVGQAFPPNQLRLEEQNTESTDDSYNTESPSNDQTLLLHDRQVPNLGRRQVGSLDDPGGGVDRSDEGSVEASAGAGGDGLVSVRVVQTPARTLQADLATMGINVEIANVEVDGSSFMCCPYAGCAKAYGNGYELKLHIMKHFKLQPFQCDYPGCSWSFVTAFKLKRHKETHSKKKDFLCTYNDCSKAFSTAYNLRVHMKAHGRPCDNVCSVCSQGFASANQLQLHIGRLHPSETQLGYPCDFPGCEKRYFSHNHLVSHKRAHNSQMLVCKVDNCGKQFTKTSHLKAHETSHSDERAYACDYEGCVARFKTYSKLSRHSKIHNKTNPLVCPECEKKFYRTEHLRAHRLTHSNQKTFQCLHQFCDKRFSGRVLLLDHIRKVHKREKTSSLLCPILDCSKRFTSLSCFESHISSHEKDLYEAQSNLQSSQDSSQLDFVALLSSVGEDILLPDELACPEYEVSSVLDDSSSSLDKSHQMIFSRQDYDSGEMGSCGDLTGSGFVKLEDEVIIARLTGTGPGEAMLTDEDPGGTTRHILVSLKDHDKHSFEACTSSMGTVERGEKLVYDTLGDSDDGPARQFSVSNSGEPSSKQQQLQLASPPIQTCLPVADGVVDAVTDASRVVVGATAMEELEVIASSNTIMGEVVVANKIGSMVGVSNVLEEVVDIDYSYMDTSEQPTLGTSLCVNSGGVFTADPILNHSTINLQDLK